MARKPTNQADDGTPQVIELDDWQLNTETLEFGLRTHGELQSLKRQRELLESQINTVHRKLVKKYGGNTVVWQGEPMPAETPTAGNVVYGNYGRPPSKAVAKRRREVKRLKDKGWGPGEIAAELLTLRQAGKLPAGLNVGVEVVRKDLQRCES